MEFIKQLSTASVYSNIMSRKPVPTGGGYKIFNRLLKEIGWLG